MPDIDNINQGTPSYHKPYDTFENKTILITGGTGSFGTAFITDLIKNYNPKKIICFSRDWLKQKDLKYKLDSIAELKTLEVMRWFIGDIRDKDRLLRAMKDVNIVIHAAAMKDLESCEYNPSEAMLTNVAGTQNVIDACIENNVERCLLISTDKAVKPINLYGITKSFAEKLWLGGNKYAATDNIKFSVCRYGNVVNSNGSIIPMWKKLIADGKTILPVTHSEMTRFWFEMEDVLKFVKSSIDKMQGGETFIPQLASVRIVDVAKAFEMPYEIIGIRENEKIHETMGQDFDSGTNPWFLTIDEIKKSISKC